MTQWALSTVSRRELFVRIIGGVSALLSLNTADVDPCDQALRVTRYLGTIVTGVRFLVLTFVANSSRSPLSSIERILL